MGLAQSAVQLVAGVIAGGAIAMAPPEGPVTGVEGAVQVVVELDLIKHPICLICWL
ncbi:hypothetical protein ABIB25_001668 [Nakamurella sp. UYEF19]|uniref:hypothetical protein n=1 Tax=Nakamurella sp. UYEF19 TaxID=1756392 RepID=UPI003396905E